MKTPVLLLTIIPLWMFSSCSSVKQTVAKVQDGTAKTLRAAKEKTLGPSEPKLRLTKAEPSRFLPAGTRAESLRIKATPSQLSEKQTRLLAKHSKPSSGPRPSQARSAANAAIPPLELPPLPQQSEDDTGEFLGILPSLDGSDTATFIDVSGETPELPAMEYPELDEEENDPEKPA